MKRIISIILIVSLFSMTAFADCREAYEAEIKAKLEKVQKTKKINRIVTGSVFGTMTAFWGAMGVIMVGPAGVIIGLQFGAVAAAPFAGTFYVVKKVKQARIRGLVRVMSAVDAAENVSDDDSQLKWLLEKLNKSRPEVTMDLLKHELTHINQTQSLCDGSISKKLPGIRQLKRYLKKNI